MFKKLLLLGLVSGVLAAIAALIYQKIYTNSLGADFSNIAKPVNIMITCTLANLLASVGYGLLTKWLPKPGEIIFNSNISIRSCMGSAPLNFIQKL